jgi:hypothetical protein
LTTAFGVRRLDAALVASVFAGVVYWQAKSGVKPPHSKILRHNGAVPFGIQNLPVGVYVADKQTAS